MRSTRRARRAESLVLAVAVATGLASVAVGSPCAAQGTSAGSRDRANRLFAQGAEAYGDGRYADAARAFREAYQLLHAPPLLYNLGRALEANGEDAAAIDAYERFLAADPRSTDRPAVEQSLATLRAREAERRAREDAARAAAAQAARPAPPPPAPVEPVRAAPVEPSGGGISPAPWVVLGIGVLAVGGGVGVGLYAQDTYNRAVAARTQQQTSELAGQANDQALVANVLFVAGGVVAVGGLIWGIADAASSGGGASASDRAARPPRRVVRVLPALGGVMVVGTF